MSRTTYECGPDNCNHFDDSTAIGETCAHPEGPLNGDDSINSLYNKFGELVGCTEGFETDKPEGDPEQNVEDLDNQETEDDITDVDVIKVEIPLSIKTGISSVIHEDIEEAGDIPKQIRGLISNLCTNLAAELGGKEEIVTKIGGVLRHYINELKL